jgi:hypothetical protein
MSGANHEESRLIHDDQLALGFEGAAKHSMAMAKGPEIFKALGRQMVVRMSKKGINSAPALGVAFESVLNDFKQDLSVNAQHRLLEYLIDHMPAEQTDYRPGNPYFSATLASFGVNAVFKHIVRGLELSDPNQLVIDTGHDYGPEPSP